MQARPKALLFVIVGAMAGGCMLPAYEVDDSLGTGGTGGTGGAQLPDLPPPPATCITDSLDDTPMVPVRGGYCIDSHEVTWANYQVFVGASAITPNQPPECEWNTLFSPPAKQGCEPPVANDDKLPVVCVDWCDAAAYCEWAGKRLCGKTGGGNNPTASFADAASSQWYNACSSGGANKYPYASDFSASACNTKEAGPGQYEEVASMDLCQPTATDYDGVYDLSGNVAEWEDSCIGTSGSGDNCRVRGGSFNDTANGVACDTEAVTLRNTEVDRIGFRCCWDP